MEISTLFDLLIERKGSDLHLVPNYNPTIRVNNELASLKTFSIITEQDSKAMILSILTPEQKENFHINKELDFGYEYKGNRFRVNIYHAKNQAAASFRLIGEKIRSIEELMLPTSLHQLAAFKQGLILVTGPTGEGKSTTLAAIINEINEKESRHIITVEDPIEYVYAPKKSIISQRELHSDTLSWTNALRSVLREDPDVVLVGEMRDYETISATLTIAETGHLVFSTLHTGSAPETINRIIDVFPSTQQNQVRSQLSTVLRAVVAQRLLPNVDRTKRIPALEILLNTSSVASIIRDNKIHMLDNVMETGETQGLMIFEKYLMMLYSKGFISQETALSYAIRPNELRKFMK